MQHPELRAIRPCSASVLGAAHPLMLPATGALCALLLACSSGTELAGTPAGPTAAATTQLLAPPPEGHGVQFAMTSPLQPGEESEHCLFVRAPSEDMFVQRDEVRFTAGSHHVLLYLTGYDQIPTAKDDGTPVDTSGVFDCSDGATNGWNVVRLIGGSQNGSGTSVLSFPKGVAKRVPANAVLMINAHYVNTKSEVVTPEIRINLYTVPDNEVEQEGDLLFLYNPLIKVAAGAAGRARMLCPVKSDITISNVQSHMHRRGMGYSAMIEGGTPFYENDQWEDVPVKVFPDGLKVSAGARLDYYCDYQNSEDHDVYQGPRSTDEMCMLIGSYYPADPTTSLCRDENGKYNAEWVGNGSGSCSDTLSCVSAHSGDLKGLTGCMMAAAPTVSKESSAVLRCASRATNPTRDCAAEISACLAK